MKTSSFHIISYLYMIAQQKLKFNPDKKTFDTLSLFFYNGQASKLDSRVDGAKGPSMRKVRAPQGKDNG